MSFYDEEISFDDPVIFVPRKYQSETDTELENGWRRGLSRQLVIWATGTGKGSLAAMRAERAKKQGYRLLFLAHRESLITQTAKRIEAQAGVSCDIEMADQYASPNAQVVCASIQTLLSTARLTGFRDDHFHEIIVDESHHSMADGYQKVLNYFHHGAHSLGEEWQPPVRGIPYSFKARVVGLTATPDIEGKKSLGDFYQHVAYEYDLLKAVNDGYLVRPISMSLRRVDLTGVKTSNTSHGSDISDKSLSERLSPFLRELAVQVKEKAGDRKSVVFVPSVECARLMDGYMRETGLNSSFVSGKCPDAAKKLEAFRAAPQGSAIANALMITEGVDIPDVSCVVIARATKVRGFYTQMAGRGSRPLPGIVDRLATAEERRAAIAASPKPNFLILDPLWIHERLKLIKPYNLITSDPRLADLMEKEEGAVNDLASMQAQAERDLLVSLEKEAKKHAHKQSKMIDPLDFAHETGNDELANYTPSTAWDELPPDQGQLDFLSRNGFQPVKYRGHADKIISVILARKVANLASPIQMKFLRQIGFKDDKILEMPSKQAGAILGRKFGRKH
jgi:superfamily II DNA or RNA helicase